MAIKTIDENSLTYVEQGSGVFKTASVGALEAVLDGFEQASIRQARSDTGPGFEYKEAMWHTAFEGDRNGTETLTTDEAKVGSKSVKFTCNSSVFNANFYNTISSVEKAYARELAIDPGAWQLNTYNRMELWVLLPPGVEKQPTTTTNFHIGTYYRPTTGARNDNETIGGWHLYHYYNLEYTGRWHKLLMDFHPSTSRAGGPWPRGSDEVGVLEYPTNEPGYNYFDLLTSMYFRILFDRPSYPVDMYMDNVRFYKEPNLENEDQVYSINGVYVPTTNELQVGWKRNKEDGGVIYEVYYAFSDIHTLGITGATLAPSGSLSTIGTGYNGMEYVNNTISMGANTSIFIAIKPVNSTLFKQIEIPLT